MKKLSLMLLSLSLLTACPAENSQEKGAETKAESPAPSVAATAESAVKTEVGLTGYYVGYFEAQKADDNKQPMYSNKINVSIDSIQGQQVTGHSVVAGNNRPFSGSLIKNAAGKFEGQAKEPGDNPYDGSFSFVLDPQSQTLTGSWVAKDAKLAVSKRSYELKKTDFKYDPARKLSLDRNWEISNGNLSEASHKSEAITPDAGKFNASLTLLKAADIDNLYKRDLEVMRNAIYARHGYSFQNRDIRALFDHGVDWYIPVSTDVTQDLTEIEKQNIALIKRYENHAAAYYDRFGR